MPSAGHVGDPRLERRSYKEGKWVQEREEMVPVLQLPQAQCYSAGIKMREDNFI